LQIHTDVAGSDIAFGCGNSDSLTETMRVEAVLPEAVTTDETGYKSVKYYELIPLVIEAL
jgi:hypothetical protein